MNLTLFQCKGSSKREKQNDKNITLLLGEKIYELQKYVLYLNVCRFELWKYPNGRAILELFVSLHRLQLDVSQKNDGKGEDEHVFLLLIQNIFFE